MQRVIKETFNQSLPVDEMGCGRPHLIMCPYVPLGQKNPEAILRYGGE
jgi:hypothetical protein